ncbi:MAG: substrate-binding domain-containing protein [Lentisphaeria bacterium]|nr:substrate-binding domain-containing protein [Lentisphaeria bacterium]
MRKPGKSELVYRRLKALARTLRPGERFPTVRQLMQSFEASQLVAKGAVDRLAAEGILEVTPGVGTYVSGANRPRRVLFWIPDWYSFSREVATLLKAEFFRRGDTVEIVSYDSGYDFLDLPPQCGAADLILIFPSHRPPSERALAVLKEAELPVIFVPATLADKEICCVGGDNYASGRMAAEFLIGQGNRSLGFFLADPRGVTSDEIEAGFADCCRRYGVSCRMLDCGTAFDESAPLAGYAFIREYLERREPVDFTGLFILNSDSAMGIMKAFREHGIRIPEELSVVGFGTPQEAALYTPSLTVVGNSRPEAARQTVLLADACFEKGMFRGEQRILPPVLIERESTVGRTVRKEFVV